ncbi:sigma-70 family RNA polymerase sigma factor [Spongiactinospora sp. TRM90649]|uniref:RNA polymerase sigma factor n=1 Tax=Spongiactinospora sp. TRM90649 TaxID=3031114 RepID=UPI0023F7C63B|nr:sigma-70 family RNA polymerase sigma factor [Spongiactinospora sp. TRM90649]MDF5757262.1 sigma-70 family RNA polymerase sigma factor [Spongiactinospora sp. TRM90649]
MSGWPNTGRADDHLLVEALRRVDAHAPASLYDAYAERLNDYACSHLPDPEAAADAVHDALVTAHGSVGRLGDAGRLRAWLYALTRFQCTARGRGRGGASPLSAPVPEAHDDQYQDYDGYGDYEDYEEPADPELTDLVHEVLGEMSGGERKVLELAVRHELTEAETASVLGLTSRQTGARLARAREHLELAAAAVVLPRIGRAHCPDLSAMVDSLEGPLPAMLRKRLSGHIGGCEVCTELRHRHVSAERLLELIPIAFPPLSLRRRVIDTCVNPEREQTRTLIAQRTERLDAAGFPVAAERRSRRRPRRLAPVVTAAVCVLAATGAVIAAGGGGGTDGLQAAPSPEGPVVFTPGPEPTGAEETPEGFFEDEPAESPAPAPAASTGTPPTPSATSGPERTTRQAVARPSPSRRPAPGASARLSVSCPGDLGRSGAGLIQFAARGKAVSWSATVSGPMGLSSRSGRLRPGASAGVWVTVHDPGEPGTGRVTIRSNGGAANCAISWRGQDVEAPEPPVDPPDTATPEPSETSSTPTQQDTLQEGER